MGFFPFFVFFIIFKNWIISPILTADDWPHFFPETLADFPLFPPAWVPTHGNGLGGEVVVYALDSYLYLVNWLFVSTLGLPWEITYKVFIFSLFILLSILSSIYLLKVTLRNISILQMIICSLLFTANTYFLMVVDGGQVGVALAYSLVPLVLARFIILIENVFVFSERKFQSALIAGLVLAIHVMFDVRIAFLTILAVGLYFLFCTIQNILKNNIRFLLHALIFVFVIPIGITLLLHMSWVLPLMFFKSILVQDVIHRQTSVGAFTYFSFASFPQTFSLLHPNWPENIFGKVYFMKPEFLLLPILAYSSLLFLDRKYIKIIAFFVFLGILGAFLAKGANEPFGLLNELFYQYIPGMSMFRDPTKFYFLIAVSYSILIPFSLVQISGKLKSKLVIKTGLLLFALCYLLFLIYPVYSNQLKGTFAYRQIPNEYLKLKDFLHSQPTFSRTLWVPRPQRYNFYSYTHPAISATGLFKASNSAEIFNYLHKPNAKQYLATISVQYIIVPYDAFGEIFVKDRKYDEKKYQDVVKELDSITWLEKIDGFGKIAVYKTPFIKDHFWTDGQGSVSYSRISPTEYAIKAEMQKPITVIFSESYNPYWIVEIDNKAVKSQKTKEGLNSFLLKETGQYRIYFVKQKVYEYGRIISAVSFFLIILLLWRLRKK